MHAFRTLHLFAGAGGGILADLLLGHSPVGAVEIDAHCQHVLRQRQAEGYLPWFPIFGDITQFDGRPWRDCVDIVAGGFPCQDLSVAGKGAGLSGARSGLWTEFARVLGEVRPQYAFIENVPALTSRGLTRILADLAALGMDAVWCCLGADDVGAPHIRKRLWILAYDSELGRRAWGARRLDPSHSRESEYALHDASHALSDQLRQQSGRGSGTDGASAALAGEHGEAGDVANAASPRCETGRCETSRALWHDARREGFDGLGPDVADAEGADVQRHAQAVNRPLTYDRRTTKAPRRRSGTTHESGRDGTERTSGGQFKPDVGRVADGLAAGVGRPWATEPCDVPRVARDIPDRVARLKALGNGQVPLTAAVAFTLLMQQCT